MASSLLDIQAVSEQLGLAVQTLYTWRTKGIGPPAIRIGNRIRYTGPKPSKRG